MQVCRWLETASSMLYIFLTPFQPAFVEALFQRQGQNTCRLVHFLFLIAEVATANHADHAHGNSSTP